MELKMEGSRVMVKLAGRLGEKEAELLKSNLYACLEQGQGEFLFDMTELRYIDSSGLGMLLAVNKQARRLGGHVVLRGLNGTVEELFEITRLKDKYIIE